MGYPPTPTQSPPHLYPQAIQLKLYQAFIFSIPILFSIILFLLFYLFYLKRRVSSPPLTLPTTTSNQPTSFPPLSERGLKGNRKDKLSVILFDEDLRTRDPQCCVCLGEFEIKEELHQIPSCKHLFHIECILHWLHSNSTCPLCRSSVVATIAATTKHVHSDPSMVPDPIMRSDQQEQLVRVNTSLANCSREQHVVLMEGSSSSSTSICMDNEMGYPNDESVHLSIRTHDT